MGPHLVVISKKEYDFLKNRSLFLNFLESGGVDSWDGYEDALESLQSIVEVVEEYDNLWKESN